MKWRCCQRHRGECAIINNGCAFEYKGENLVMPAQNRRKRQVGITHHGGKRLLSMGSQPLFKVSADDYFKMASPKPSVYATKSEGNKHYYLLFDRRKQPRQGKQ